MTNTTMIMMRVVVSMVISSVYFVHDTLISLLPQDLLDLTNLFLYFSGYLFGFAFGLQLGIIGDFPGHLFNLTLCLVQGTFHFVIHTGFHYIPPLGFLFDC
jgi:hypothetical protein